MRSRSIVLGLLWIGSGLVAGCADNTVHDLRIENTRLRESFERREHELASQRVTIEKLHQQLAVTRALSEDDLKKIYYPEKLVIARLTGGENYDGKPGDDGVTVFLQPVDRDGDTLKVVGDIRVELFDLEAESDRLVGRCVISADKVSELWYGKMMTQHYTIRCPWTRVPAHSEITVRATFVDYLTQRVITAQVTCTVSLPPR